MCCFNIRENHATFFQFVVLLPSRGMKLPPLTSTPSNLPNSRNRVPMRQWVRLWLCAMLLFVGCVGSLDAICRRQGFRPTVDDSLDLWHFWRQQVYRNDGRVLVFLGTSRVQSDVSLTTLGERLPGYTIVQLGLVWRDKLRRASRRAGG